MQIFVTHPPWGRIKGNANHLVSTFHVLIVYRFSSKRGLHLEGPFSFLAILFPGSVGSERSQRRLRSGRGKLLCPSPDACATGQVGRQSTPGYAPRGRSPGARLFRPVGETFFSPDHRSGYRTPHPSKVEPTQVQEERCQQRPHPNPSKTFKRPIERKKPRALTKIPNNPRSG